MELCFYTPARGAAAAFSQRSLCKATEAEPARGQLGATVLEQRRGQPGTVKNAQGPWGIKADCVWSPSPRWFARDPAMIFAALRRVLRSDVGRRAREAQHPAGTAESKNPMEQKATHQEAQA